MKQDLRETRAQGTTERPLKIYYMKNGEYRIDIPYHWQEHVEILWIQQGKLNLKIGEKTYIGNTGDFFYINPHELHSMQSENTDCFYLAFLFPLQWIQFSHIDEAEEQCISPLLAGNAQVISHLPQDVAKLSKIIFQEIYDLYNSNAAGSWLGIKANLLRFYAYMYQYELIFLKERENSAQTNLLLEITSYIETHCNEKLTLEHLGKTFHMSPKYFSVYFQKHFLKNFTDYLTAVRLEMAKKLLIETDYEIELVAQKSGFSTSSYFIRIFRSCTDTTPLQYRKNFNKNLWNI